MPTLRKLNHLDTGINNLGGQNDSLRAVKDETGACVIYHETRV